MNIAIGLSVLVLARHPKPPPPPTSAVIDVSSYAVDLVLDHSSGTFTTKTTLKLTSKTASDLVVLDSSGLEITSATLGGAAATTSLAKQPNGDDVLTVKLPAPLAVDTEVTLEIQAKGKASEGGDLGLIKQLDPEDPSRVLYYTMFEPTGARRVFPCHDVPDDKATFEFAVTTDADQKVLSNGTQSADDAIEGDGPKRHKVTWKLDKPQSTYLATVVIGPFEHVTKSGGIPLGLYTSSATKDAAKAPLEATAKATAFLADFLETPFPWDHYDQVAVPGMIDSGMEDTTLSLIRASTALGPTADAHLDRNARIGVLTHELAHQWTGDDVTFKTWGDVWLSESLATYLGRQAEADYTSNDSVWVRSMLANRDEYFREDDGPRSHAIAQAVANPLEAFDAINCLKGSSVLRMLEDHVGRESMRKSLKTYLDAHAYGNATTDEFFADVEKATGKDLKAFNQAWVHEAGYPVVKIGFVWLSGAKQAVLAVSQHPSRGSRTSFPGTLVAVAHRSTDPVYDREIPLPMGGKGDTIGVELPDQPEWINWNKGGAYLAKFEHNIPLVQLQAEAMKDTDPTARLWAQLELAGSLANPDLKGSPSPAALQTLAEALKTDHSPYVRAGLMRELAHGEGKLLPYPIDDAVFFEANLPGGLPNDPTGLAEVKSAGLALLGKVSLAAADKLLQTQIKDADLAYDLLQGTVEGLATHGNGSVLRDALKTHGGRGPAYRRAVLSGISRSGTDEAGPILLTEAKASHANAEDVRAILTGVSLNPSLLRSAAGATLLESLATDTSFNDELRARAVRLLEPAKSPPAKAALGRLVKSSNVRLAALANQALRGH